MNKSSSSVSTKGTCLRLEVYFEISTDSGIRRVVVVLGFS